MTSRPTTYRIAATILLALTGSLALTGCSNDVEDPLPTLERPVSSSFLLTKSQSCSELRDSYVDDLTEMILDTYPEFVEYETSGDPDPLGEIYDDQAEAEPPSRGKGPRGPQPGSKGSVDNSGTAGSPSHTGTNNHEADADESDWIKTNGNYTFILRKGQLVIAKTWKPAEAKVVKTFDISTFKKTADQAYIDKTLQRKTYSRRPDHGYKGHDIRPEEAKPPYDTPYAHEETYSPCDGNYAECLEPQELSFDGDYLYIYARFNLKNRYTKKGSNLKGIESGTRVIVLDVNDPENPKINNIVDLESSFEDARTVPSGTFVIQRGRSIGDMESWFTTTRRKEISKRLYPIGTPTGVPLPKLSNSHTEEDYRLIQDYYDRVNNVHERRIKEARYRIHKYLKENFSDEDLQRALPKQVSYNQSFTPVLTKPLVPCDQYYVASAGRHFSAITVTKVPTSSQREALSTGLIAGLSTVYSNGTSLYLAQQFFPSMKDWRGNGELTAIHKFSYPPSDGRVQFKGSGSLYGSLLNQYSMSEYDGYLRVVTTESGARPGDSSSNVSTKEGVANPRTEDTNSQPPRRTFGLSNTLSILKDKDGALEKVSEIKDLAPGERVYSARFIGDKGYVVTFRQVDPLFSFDLKDPLHPKLIGALKIPGYSSYIHPLGKNHLLTIGRDGDDRGRINGLKIQIFDATNPAKVLPAFDYVIPGDRWNSHSIAEYDPHAFTFDPETGLLVIPVERHGVHGDSDWSDFFDGFQYFSISTTNGINKLGELDHFNELMQPTCNTTNAAECYFRYNYGYGYDRAYRSIIMKDPSDTSKAFIYTLSRYGFFIQDATNLDQLSKVPF